MQKILVPYNESEPHFFSDSLDKMSLQELQLRPISLIKDKMIYLLKVASVVDPLHVYGYIMETYPHTSGASWCSISGVKLSDFINSEIKNGQSVYIFDGFEEFSHWLVEKVIEFEKKKVNR